MLHTASDLADGFAEGIFAACDSNWFDTVEAVSHNSKLTLVVRTPTVNVPSFRLS